MRVIFRDTDQRVVKAMQERFADVPEFEATLGDIFSDIGAADAVISPANSYGHMDGGIDARYVEYFGRSLQESIYAKLHNVHGGFLPVGSATVVATQHRIIPYMICAPTMELPSVVAESDNAYRAFLAALLAARERGFSIVLTPGLATCKGAMPPDKAAWQLREAWRMFQAQPDMTLAGLVRSPLPPPGWLRRWFGGMHAGLVLRWGSFWVGWHYSRYNRRLCINLIPFITIWVTQRGGVAPRKT